MPEINFEQLKRRLSDPKLWPLIGDLGTEVLDAIAALERELEALKHDIERSLETSSSLATELEEVRKSVTWKRQSEGCFVLDNLPLPPVEGPAIIVHSGAQFLALQAVTLDWDERKELLQTAARHGQG